MEQQAKGETRVFGANKNMLVAFAVMFGLGAALPLAVAIKNGDQASAWKVLAFLVGLELLVLLVGRLIRLEIGPESVEHRTALGTRSLALASVKSAHVQVLSRSKGPGCPTLCLEPEKGRRVTIYLRHYPIEASVALFTALESRGIDIELPDDDAISVAEQIAAAKLSAAR